MTNAKLIKEYEDDARVNFTVKIRLNDKDVAIKTAKFLREMAEIAQNSRDLGMSYLWYYDLADIIENK